MDKKKDKKKRYVSIITGINSVMIMITLGMAGFGMFLRFAGSMIRSHLKVITDFVLDQLKNNGMDEVDMSNFDLVELISPLTTPLIVAGFMLGLVSLVGTVSARGKYYITLIPYAAFLVLLLGLQSAFIVVVFEKRQVLDGYLMPWFETNLHENYRGYNETDIVTQTWNVVMISLNCCGLNGYQDFKNCKHWRRKLFLDGWWFELKTPMTCCKLDRKEPDDFSCAVNPAPYASYYENGCYEAVWTHIDSYKTYAFVVFGGVAALQVVLLIATVILTSKLIKEKKRAKESNEEINENEVNERIDNYYPTGNTDDDSGFTQPGHMPSVRDGLFSFLPFGAFNNNIGGGFSQFPNMDKRYSMPPDVLSMLIASQNGCPAPGYDFTNGVGRSSYPNAFGTSGPVIVQLPATPPVHKAITAAPSTARQDDSFAVELQDPPSNKVPPLPPRGERDLRNKFNRCNSEGFINFKNKINNPEHDQLKRGNTIARY